MELVPYSMPSDPRSRPDHQSQHIEDRRQMTAENHAQLANFIWSICNLLRGPYKRNEYRKVILPLTVPRRFDCLLAVTKPQVLAEHPRIKTKPETVVRSLLEKISGRPF
jgi:type I restriction enzyme M protein